MANKVLADIYYTYGKGEGAELDDRILLDLDKESLEDIFDCFNYDDSMDSKEAFLNGEQDVFNFDSYGGDWDEPTGGFVVVSTKEELLAKIERKSEREKDEVERLFNM